MRTRKRYPVVAMRAQVVLPGAVARFDLSRSRTVAAVEAAMLRDGLIFLVAQKDPEEIDPGETGIYRYGTLCQIRSLTRTSHNTRRAMLFGIRRCSVEQLVLEGEAYEAEIFNAPLRAIEKNGEETEAMLRALKGYLQLYAREDKGFAERYLPRLISETGLMQLLRASSSQLPWAWGTGQRLLECNTGEEFYEVLTGELTREIDVVRMRHEYEQKLRLRLDKSQREFMLREQMRIIQEELGEAAEAETDAKSYEGRIAALTASAEVKQSLLRETARLARLPQGTQEYALQQNYLDTVLSLPFDRSAACKSSLREARRILDRDHYGLEQVKERILDSLAVRQLNPEAAQEVICLVGPPGTGKTSIARSIAEALGRRFARISLGGVQDEAEIRGHRRTYVGAMPGRVADALRRAACKNPLILLDEIDKLSKEYRGMAATAALLEVLDSAQNRNFRDHYAELPMDLSQVFFLATANTTEGIPAPLLDRMTLVHLNSYTETEKFHIAKRFLLPRTRRNAGLSEDRLTWTDGALRKLIREYTREAGVRAAERSLREVAEKCARKLLLREAERFEVTAATLSDYLGKPRYPQQRMHRRAEIGLAYGLAYTAVGGVALSVEVDVNRGRGLFRPTGQMGAVMRESAELAFAVAKREAIGRGLPAAFFREADVHLHIPAGAVQKDGPSAGAAMALALLSACIGAPVRADLAVTGEITLRGHILPVGGLKEKLLAAAREHFTELALPFENRGEAEGLPPEITAGLTIHYIKEFRELAALALTGRGEETDGEKDDNSTPFGGRCLWEKAADCEEGEGEEEGD